MPGAWPDPVAVSQDPGEPQLTALPLVPPARSRAVAENQVGFIRNNSWSRAALPGDLPRGRGSSERRDQRDKTRRQHGRT